MESRSQEEIEISRKQAIERLKRKIFESSQEFSQHEPKHSLIEINRSATSKPNIDSCQLSNSSAQTQLSSQSYSFFNNQNNLDNKNSLSDLDNSLSTTSQCYFSSQSQSSRNNFIASQNTVSNSQSLTNLKGQNLALYSDVKQNSQSSTLSASKIDAHYELMDKNKLSIRPSNSISREFILSVLQSKCSLSKNGYIEVSLEQFIHSVADLKKKIRIPTSYEKSLLELFKYSNSLQNTYNDTLLDELCRKNLILPYQMEGIRFGIGRAGRFLLADDMGLGKTLQALMIVYFYRNEWPLLIVCPASLIATWSEAVQKAYENVVDSSEIKAYFDSKEFSLNTKISITSFDLVVRNGPFVKEKQFKVIIIDECHFIKSVSTKRTKTILPILKDSSRLIMLSGTPALSRPIELYTQLSAINNRMFSNYNEFGFRYCDGYKFKFGVNFQGSSHTKELNILLENTVMLRRTKQQVLQWLPAKIRKQIFLHVSTKVKNPAESKSVQLEKLADTNSTAFQQWKSTTQQKMPAILKYLEELLVENNDEKASSKLLLFGHFKDTLDEIEHWLDKHKIVHVRMDGDTESKKRQDLCNDFQTNPKIKVALLSITAASVGLTLTSANIVIFMELFWNPGVLMQAEDRAHRIGQKDSVIVQYLLGKGTFDDYLWPMLVRKLSTLEQVGLAKNDFGASSMQTNDRSAIDARQTKLSFENEREL